VDATSPSQSLPRIGSQLYRRSILPQRDGPKADHPEGFTFNSTYKWSRAMRREPDPPLLPLWHTRTS
jgi:hypothetical protein